MSDKSYEDYLEELVKETAKKLSRNKKEYYKVYHQMEKKKETILKMQSNEPTVTVTSDDIIGVGTNVTTSVLDSKYQNIIMKELPEITPAKSLLPATILVSGYNVAKEANKKDGDPLKQTTIEAASVGTSAAVSTTTSSIVSSFVGAKYGALAGPIGIFAGAAAGYAVSRYGDTWYGSLKKQAEHEQKNFFHPYIKKYRNKQGDLKSYKPQYGIEISKNESKKRSKAVPYGFARSPEYKNNQLENFQNARRKNQEIIAKKQAPKKKDNFFSRLKKGLWNLFKHNANGSFVNKPILSWVGEEGPEVIIPLSGQKRDRGLDLWEQAGKALGVTGYASGGIVGGTVRKQRMQNHRQQGQEGINVSVGNINISLKGGGGKEKSTNLLPVLREHKEEISDELCNILADALESAYQNIPAVS